MPNIQFIKEEKSMKKIIHKSILVRERILRALEAHPEIIIVDSHSNNNA